ncbi:MAG: ABC transporter substrate-binding protein, partial [Lapillicoccus sp.]
SLVPPGIPGHQDDQFIKFDVAQAKKDFETALAALGTTLDNLNLELGYNVNGVNADLAGFVQAQWETTFGIDIKLTSMGDFGDYLRRLTNEPFDIFRLGGGFPYHYPHPSSFLTALISCTSGNAMGYCNPQVDALLEEAASKADLDEQVALYDQAQAMVMADTPIIPLSFGARFTLVKPWVLGLTLTANHYGDAGGLFDYRVSIAPHN